MKKSLIGRPFKEIKKFTLIEKNKTKDYFKVWFPDKSTAVYNADNIVVMKTFTPDQPGNFTGGNINIKTKEFPNKR